MARDSTERRFLEVLGRSGGPQRVLLVGEQWERAESRAALQVFMRTVFPEGGGEPQAGRARRFSLVFFLCRAESLRLRESRQQLKEILRDVRDRTPGGGAVIGVITEQGSPLQDDLAAAREISEGPGANLGPAASLLHLLHSVFTPGTGRWPEVRAGVLLRGHEEEESRRELQRLACEALTAADEQKSQRRRLPLIQCFSFFRRSRRKGEPVPKDHPEEGTALTVLNHHNGDCAKSSTDA